jgi:hypothetical protein
MNPYAVFSRSLLDDIALDEGVAALRSIIPMRGGQSIFTYGPRLEPNGAAMMKKPLELPLTTTSWSRAVELVQIALSDPGYDFRPLDRIAQVTGLSTNEALRALSAPGVARRPWGNPASNLFAPADRPVSPREAVSGLRAMVAKRS